MSSSEDFMIFRGFKTLHCRSLLYLLIEVTELEKKLDDIDKKDIINKHTKRRLSRVLPDGCGDPTQRKLMKEIFDKLNNYGEFQDVNLRCVGECDRGLAKNNRQDVVEF
jgi:hypothetical protein